MTAKQTDELLEHEIDDLCDRVIDPSIDDKQRRELWMQFCSAICNRSNAQVKRMEVKRGLQR